MPTTITKPQHHTTIRVFCVAEIQRNPFRDSERYPLEDKKIKALRESYRATGFWHNLVARIGKDGKPEIVYGHHRLEALRLEFRGDFEVRLIIEEISGEQMLKRMLWENMEQWQTYAPGHQASIRMVVNAYAAGRVELQPPDPNGRKDRWRYAPGFRQGDVAGAHRQRPYTAATVADFLGWDRTKVECTLAALELIERNVVDEDFYDGLTQTQAGVLTTGVRKAVYAHDTQAKELEKQATTDRKLAKETKNEKERDALEKLAESALQEAAAVRKRGEEQGAHVASRAHLLLQDGTTRRRVLAELAGLTELPPLPRPRDKEPVDEIAEYLDRLPEYTAHVRQVRAHVERFSPKQIEKVFNGGGALQQELAALDTDLKDVVRKRQRRDGARIERSGKEKQHKPRRYGVVAKKRGPRANALV